MSTQVCYTWGNAAVAWPNTDWTWEDCQIVYECITWGNAGALWQDANWLWPACSSSAVPRIPTDASIFGQPSGIDATTLIQPWLIEPWNPYKAADRNQEKKKRLIKLICKVKGQTFEEEKAIENYEISVDDIRMVVQTVAGVDLDIKKLKE
jgi:hypothetical protein